MLRTVLAISLFATPLTAQAPADPLARFHQMVGEWDGEAWTIRGPEGRQTVRQQEWVTTEAGGTVVVIRGLGTLMVDGKEQVVHRAFAVVHRNRERTGLMMRAFTAEGHWLDPEIVATEKGYTWYMTDPRIGRIRYEVALDEQGRWVEDGYASRDDGKTWSHFLGMVLTRKP